MTKENLLLQYVGADSCKMVLWLMPSQKKLSSSGKRRVTVREFEEVPLVDIREFWTNDGGELKPGKKVSNCIGCSQVG